MRKLWFMAVAALLVIAVAAPSFAAETTFSGNYRIRSVMDYNWEKRNMTAGTYNDDPLYTSYFDQRFRLTITHKRSEFLKAVVMIDLAEDMWGQDRAMRMNAVGPGPTGTLDEGFISTAYIEAVTPIGLIRAGTDGTTRFGYGLWSDSGMKGNGSNNATVTYGIKIKNVIATMSYCKYVDFVQPVLANAQGVPAATFRVWPGRVPLDIVGGSTSNYYNSDIDTYIWTVHYIGDKFKAGALFQWILSPHVTGAGLLVRGITDIGLVPASFRGEMNWMNFTQGGGWWPIPIGSPTGTTGMGRMGMYDANLYLFSMYANLKLLNDKLEVKGEWVRIFGSGNLISLGEAYNNFLATRPAAAPFPDYRLPQNIGVDGMTAYFDVSYDFEVAKVGVAFLYGSGEANWTPFTQRHYNFNTTGNDDFKWGNVIVPGDWEDQGLGAAGGPLGLGNNPENVTSVKLYWSVMPMEKLDIHGAFIWAKYTNPVGRYARTPAGALVYNWNAFYGHPMNYLDPAYIAGGNEYIPANVSDNLGWEIDVGATYEIMEGLSLNSEFGVLFTGDAFDYRNPVTMEREDWGPIYRWVNTLTYEF
jgi:hypothetical protein